MTVVDVVILSLCKDKSFFELNVNCISSLISSETEIRFEIHLIESNSRWKTLGFEYPFKNVHVHERSDPFHYNKFLNFGVTKAQHDYIVFSNNDVIFHKNWLSEILKVRYDDPSIRSFCPFDHESKYLKWEKFKNGRYQLGYRVPVEFVGWCFVVERSVFDETGPFDERFDLYFQDNDFARTLKKHHIPHALVPTSNVHHLGGATTGVADASKTMKYIIDKAKYMYKWPNEPYLIQGLWRRLKSCLAFSDLN